MLLIRWSAVDESGNTNYTRWKWKRWLLPTPTVPEILHVGIAGAALDWRNAFFWVGRKKQGLGGLWIATMPLCSQYPASRGHQQGWSQKEKTKHGGQNLRSEEAK
jgi:hypothetical protein